MTDPTTDDEHATDGGRTTDVGIVRSTSRLGGRLVGDFLALTLWALLVTLLFLETGWPRWAFYGLLLLGVAVYVSVTAPWIRR